MVKLLLKKGSDPNVGSYKKPLYYAIEMGPPEVVELLLKAGADPNEIAELNEIEYDKTPLQLALGSNYTLYDNTLENFKLLLKYGANPNTFLPGYNGNLNVLEDILMNYAGDDAMPRELQIELVNLLLLPFSNDMSLWKTT